MNTLCMDPGIRHIQISTRPQAYYYLGKYNEAYPAKAISWGHPAWRFHAITFRIAWSSSVALAIEVRLVLFTIPLFPAKSPRNCRCTVVEVRYSHSASPAFSGRGPGNSPLSRLAWGQPFTQASVKMSHTTWRGLTPEEPQA